MNDVPNKKRISANLFERRLPKIAMVRRTPLGKLETDSGFSYIKRVVLNNCQFTTEQFIAESIADLKNQVEINDRFVFALGWSLGGPALYVNSVNRESPVTGTFVAMSVFQPKLMPNLSLAKEHPYFILHSPDDWIKIDQHAREAIKTLDKAGAKTHSRLYDGGHGWVNDPCGNINRGGLWLQENVADHDMEK